MQLYNILFGNYFGHFKHVCMSVCRSNRLQGTLADWDSRVLGGRDQEAWGGQCIIGFTGTINFSDIWVIWVVFILIHHMPC